jgi:hypothetical protein
MLRLGGLLSGRLVLLLVLTVALALGCVQAQVASNYKVKIPVLNAATEPSECVIAVNVDGIVMKKLGSCVTLLEDDWKAVVRELKSACLALGGTDEECQTK